MSTPVIHSASMRVPRSVLESIGVAYIVRRNHEVLGLMLARYPGRPGPLRTYREGGHWLEFDDDEPLWIPPSVLFTREVVIE